jgi:hypothetical protein
MIGSHMANIIKRFARHRDDMRLANFQRGRALDAEWKLLRCPTEYCLPNLTPPWANRNLGANRSNVVSGGIPARRNLGPNLFPFTITVSRVRRYTDLRKRGLNGIS